jgi:hypothetical protein
MYHVQEICVALCHGADSVTIFENFDYFNYYIQISSLVEYLRVRYYIVSNL